MAFYQEPGVRERQSAASEKKKALLEKFRASMNDPDRAKKEAERAAIVEARAKRQAERDAQKEAQRLVEAEKARVAAEAAAAKKKEADAEAARLAAEDAELKRCFSQNRRRRATPATPPARRPRSSGARASRKAALRSFALMLIGRA